MLVETNCKWTTRQECVKASRFHDQTSDTTFRSKLKPFPTRPNILNPIPIPLVPRFLLHRSITCPNPIQPIRIHLNSHKAFRRGGKVEAERFRRRGKARPADAGVSRFRVVGVDPRNGGVDPKGKHRSSARDWWPTGEAVEVGCLCWGRVREGGKFLGLGACAGRG